MYKRIGAQVITIMAMGNDDDDDGPDDDKEADVWKMILLWLAAGYGGVAMMIMAIAMSMRPVVIMLIVMVIG